MNAREIYHTGLWHGAAVGFQVGALVTMAVMLVAATVGSGR